MPKFDVWVFPIMRVCVRGVEAGSPEEAIKKADGIFGDGSGFSPEYADDVDCYHVDVIGDVDYRQSRWYDKHGNVLEKSADRQLS